MSRSKRRPVFARPPRGDAAGDTSPTPAAAEAAETTPGASEGAVVDAAPADAPALPPAGPLDAPAAPSGDAAPPGPADAPAAPPVTPDAPPSGPSAEEMLADLRARVTNLVAENEWLASERDAAVNRWRVAEATLAAADAENAKLRALYAPELALSVATARPAMPTEPPATAPAAAVAMVPVVHHASLRFRGRDYAPGARFPFDPKNPPADVLATFVEGVDYVYKA